MASKKLGNLIKEARTEAGLTQEQLARRIAGLSASDISQATSLPTPIATR